MAKLEKALPLLLVLVFVSTAAAFELSVVVDPLKNVSVKGLEYDNSSQVQDVVLNLDNTGSVGCTYRVKAVSEYNNTFYEHYSKEYPIWPGSNSDVDMSFALANKSGQVNTSLFISYCDGEQFLESFNWTSEPVGTINEVNSETLSASETSVKAEFSRENGSLVPVETPPYWKVSSAKIENSTAELTYNPSIFKETNLTYAVTNEEGSIIGKTEVSLKDPEPSLKQKILDNKWFLFAALFALSLIGNLLLLRKRIVPDKVNEKAVELKSKIKR